MQAWPPPCGRLDGERGGFRRGSGLGLLNVLIIPEDFRKDQYLLRPILQRLAAALRGRGNVRVRVCMDPLLGGVGEALKSERLADVVRQYRGMTDVFILCVDRDGVATRRRRLDELEREFRESGLLAVNAWEEIETWALAGLTDLPDGWHWRDIRAAVDVKERYFEPPGACAVGTAQAPGRRRERMRARRPSSSRSELPTRPQGRASEAARTGRYTRWWSEATRRGGISPGAGNPPEVPGGLRSSRRPPRSASCSGSGNRGVVRRPARLVPVEDRQAFHQPSVGPEVAAGGVEDGSVVPHGDGAGFPA